MPVQFPQNGNSRYEYDPGTVEFRRADAWSILLWFRVDVTDDDDNGLITQYAADDVVEVMRLRVDAGSEPQNLELHINNSVPISTDQEIDLDIWYAVLVTCDGSESADDLTIYVWDSTNGTMVIDGETGTHPGDATGTPPPIAYGIARFDTTEPLAGAMGFVLYSDQAAYSREEFFEYIDDSRSFAFRHANEMFMAHFLEYPDDLADRSGNSRNLTKFGTGQTQSVGLPVAYSPIVRPGYSSASAAGPLTGTATTATASISENDVDGTKQAAKAGTTTAVSESATANDVVGSLSAGQNETATTAAATITANSPTGANQTALTRATAPASVSATENDVTGANGTSLAGTSETASASVTEISPTGNTQSALAGITVPDTLSVSANTVTGSVTSGQSRTTTAASASVTANTAAGAKQSAKEGATATESVTLTANPVSSIPTAPQVRSTVKPFFSLNKNNVTGANQANRTGETDAATANAIANAVTGAIAGQIATTIAETTANANDVAAANQAALARTLQAAVVSATINNVSGTLGTALTGLLEAAQAQANALSAVGSIGVPLAATLQSASATVTANAVSNNPFIPHKIIDLRSNWCSDDIIDLTSNFQFKE